MKKPAYTFALIVAAMAGSHVARASDGVRVTYDPHDLNRAVYEIDLVEQCDHKTECSVDVLPGLALKIKSTTDSTVAFDRKNDYSASGMVSQHVADAQLPANPCIESPFPILSFFWKPGFENRGKSPSGWKPETLQFTGVTRAGFAFMDIPGTPKQFCIQPQGHFNEEKRRPAFAVFSVRLEANLGKVAGDVAFADTMKRATQILGDRVEDAINNAQILEDDAEHLNREAAPQLRLLVSALAGLRVALNPPPLGSSIDFPSSADDGIRRAVHVAVRAWSYVLPYLDATKAEEKPIPRGVDPTIRKYIYGAHAFNSSIRWLTADMEAIRVVYGESANRNYGKSQFVVPLAELLLAQLERLRAITANEVASEAAPPQDVFKWLSATQELAIELRDAAFNGGDKSPSISTDVMPRLAILWNSVSSQKLLEGLWTSNAKEDLRVFLAFLDTLKKLPAAEKVEFKKVTFAKDLSSLSNGGEVRCSIDPDGEYCYVDLLAHCQGRMACSTKLSFNGHWVAANSRTGMHKASQDLGGWVRGEERPVVPAGAMLPANTEVCSDLPIVSVLYRPTNPKDRWTKESGGFISGRTQFQPERVTVYPPLDNHSLSSRCIVFDAAADEGAYIIKSVRVKIDLDKERTSLLNMLMINAARRLKQDLQDASRIARDHESFLSAQAPAIKEYRRAIDTLIREIDKSLFRFVSMPVTLPEVRDASANLYVRANLLLSASKGHEVEAQGYMTRLKQVITQLSLGFGLNRAILSPAELTVDKGPSRQSPEEVVKKLKGFIETSKVYQSVLPPPYQDAIRGYITALSSLLKAVEAAPKIKHRHEAFPHLTNASAKAEASKAVTAVGNLIALMQRYPKIYAEFIKNFTNERTYIAETFVLEGPADFGHKLAPLVEVLGFAVSEGTRQLALKWSDPLYVAAYGVQSLLRDELLPAARGPNGDEAAARALPKLGQLWMSAEFQFFLLRVGRSGQSIEAIVNQIQATLGLNLANLGLILPARY